MHKLKGRFCWFQSRGRQGPLLSRLTHANETKNATHTIIFLIVVILKSFPFPSSIYGAIVLVFSKSRNGSRICTAASRGFYLAWLLASTRSFAWLVCRIVGFIATFSIYIILWLLHKFSNICKPEEGWYGQPKYCYRKQLHVVLNQLCSSLWTSRSWFVCSSHRSHANE